MIMSVAFHTLEVTVISAEKLTTNYRPFKNKAFASLRTDNNDSRSPDSKSYSTGINKDGGQFPSWKEKLTVSLPVSSRGVVVDICSKGKSRDKIVGTARIPVSDFMGEFSVPMLNHLHFLSYLLRDSRGIRNGIINVSIRVTASSTSSAGLGNQDRYIGYGYEGGRGTVIGFPDMGSTRLK